MLFENRFNVLVASQKVEQDICESLFDLFLCEKAYAVYSFMCVGPGPPSEGQCNDAPVIARHPDRKAFYLDRRRPFDFGGVLHDLGDVEGRAALAFVERFVNISTPSLHRWFRIEPILDCFIP